MASRLQPIGAAPLNELCISPSVSHDRLPQDGYTVCLAESACVEELCIALGDQLSVACTDVSFAFEGQELDPKLTLQQINVLPGAQVQLTFALRAGVLPFLGISPTETPNAVRTMVSEWQTNPPEDTARPPLTELLHLHTKGFANSWIQAGTCTAFGPRPANEDADICLCDWTSLKGMTGPNNAETPVALFAVCDGHGGSTVSAKVAKEFGACLQAHLDGCDWEQKHARKTAIQRAFIEMDASIKQECSADRCGSTCTVAVIWSIDAGSTYKVILANSGDSRGLFYGVDADVLSETLDHKPDDPCEKKRIREAGGYVAALDPPARLDGVLALSRGFGDFRFKADASRAPEAQKISPSPDVYEFEAKNGDTVILACDGIFDVLSSTEVAALVRYVIVTNPSCESKQVEAAATLAWAALQRDTQDNVTAVIIQCGSGSSTPRTWR